MTQNENKQPQTQPIALTKKKPSLSWGFNPVMPLLPHHIVAVLAEKTEFPLNKKQSRIKRLDIYEINLQMKLGSGFSSDAYRALNTETNTEVCIKVIDYLGLKSQEERKMVESEIWCLKHLSNPHILKCFDVLESQDFCYIVTELCDSGDLYKRLCLKGCYSQSEVVPMMRDLALALLELKTKRIVHRDIKSSNILLKEGAIKLCDFGFAAKEDSLQVREKFNLGSPLYMSPEALIENQYGFASDVFSLGVTIFELLHKTTPWETNSQAELKAKITTEEVRFKEGLSEELKSVLRWCLQKEVSKRASIEDVLSCPLLK